MLYYCLAALAVILITAAVTFFIFRKKNLATRENIINLAICTVLAMVCATLTPLLANLMVQELYFSIILSVVCAFVVVVGLSFAAFLLSRRLLANNKDEVSFQQDISSIVRVDELSHAGIAGLDSAAVVNETAIISKVEGHQSVAFHANAIDAINNMALPEDKEINAFPETFHVAGLIDRAMECKRVHHIPEAITFYEKAIELQPDADLLTWILIDLCSLYKRTNQKELANRILQAEPCSLVNNKVKEDILQNL